MAQVLAHENLSDATQELCSEIEHFTEWVRQYGSPEQLLKAFADVREKINTLSQV